MATYSFSEVQLTDVGLAFLWLDDGVHGQCKKLEQLDLTGGYEHVTAHGLLALLENLPRVRRIVHPASLEALVIFVRKYNPKKLNMTTSFEITSNQSSTTTIQNKDVEKLLNYEPKIKSITLNGDVNLPSLFKINDENLELNCKSNISITFMKEIFINIGANITSLCITKFDENEMDPSIIAKFCTKLEELRFHCKSTSTFAHTFENTFTFLTFLSITSQNFPVVALESIMSSEDLKSVLLANMDNLTDLFLLRMIRISMSNNVILSKIQHLHLENINEISFDFLKQFVCNTTLRSSSLRIEKCAKISEAQVQQLSAFISSLFVQ